MGHTEHHQPFDVGELAKKLTSTAGEVNLVQGVVSAVGSGGSSCSVKIGGSTTAIAGIRSLTPTSIGDVVWVLSVGTFLLVVANLDTGWHVVGGAGEPAFQNSWVNFGAQFPGARFRKVGGVVYLSGLIKSGTMATTAFTLPAGYRPTSAARMFAVATGTGFGRLDVNGDGTVQPQSGSNSWVSLELCFIAEDT